MCALLPKEAHETVLRWLQEILADSRSHRSIGADPIFSLRGLLPVPFQKALARVSAKEGWPAESLMNAMFTNIGWLEHHHTRLLEYPGEEHGRSPNIPCFHGMDPSARKSSLKEYCSSTLLNVEEAPEFIRDGLATSTDGTVRGHRTSIVSYQRSGVVSDEVSNTYETPYSEQGRGIHYLGRSKLATYVNCERDTQVTGNGPVHLAGYSFVHHVWGQVPAVEYALRPTPGGFQKRFNIVFPGTTKSEPDLPCSHSKAFLIDFHKWMCRHALVEARLPSFDARALTLFRTVRQAIDEFIEGAPGLSAYDIVKLKFADTDLLRMTNAIMRCTAFAEGQSGVPLAEQPPGGSHTRRYFSLFELVYAIRLWQRQLSLHFGYYRTTQERSADQWRSPEAPAAPQDPYAGLATQDLVEKLVLEDKRWPESGIADTTVFYNWVKNRMVARGRLQGLAVVVKSAAKELSRSGLLLTADTPSSAQGKRRRTEFYRKPTWSNIGDTGKARMAELRVSADAFED